MNRTCKDSLNRLHHAACAFGLLISLTSLPAFGQHIHQLSYNGSTWVDEPLPSAQTTVITSIASILTTPNNQEHVYYFAGEEEVADMHQLFYNGTNWSDEDLTAEAGAPHANPYSIAAFSVGNYQYVYYIDLYGDVHQLLYNNSYWADTDLTEIAGGPQAIGQLLAFTTAPAVHIFYREGSNSDVHQLFNTNGTNWQDQDLTVVTGGPAAGGSLSGFNIGNNQYIYLIADGGHVHQFLYNNFNWSDEDLTALSKSPPSQGGNSVTAFVVPGTKKLRVYVQAENLHILQLASNNNVKWNSSDLTKKTKAPSPGYPNTSTVGFASANTQIQVYYASEQSQLNQFLLPAHETTWQNSDLMPGPIGGVLPQAGIAGFSLQNLPYVFYEGD
jgi:Fungal fucose-specific lectin